MRSYRHISMDDLIPDMESSDLPSVTVPDESLTVREILTRFTTGTVPPIARQGAYDDDDYFTDDNIDHENVIEDITDSFYGAQHAASVLEEERRRKEQQDIDFQLAQRQERRKERIEKFKAILPSGVVIPDSSFDLFE